MSDVAEHHADDAPEHMTQIPTTTSHEADQAPATSLTRSAQAEQGSAEASGSLAPRRRGRPRKSVVDSTGEVEEGAAVSQIGTAAKKTATKKIIPKEAAEKKAADGDVDKEAVDKKTARKSTASKKAGKASNEGDTEKKDEAVKTPIASRTRAAVKTGRPQEESKHSVEDAGAVSSAEVAGGEQPVAAKPKRKPGRFKKRTAEAESISAGDEAQPEGREEAEKASGPVKTKASKDSKPTKTNAVKSADVPQAETSDDAERPAKMKTGKAVKTRASKANKASKAVKDVQPERSAKSKRSRKKVAEVTERLGADQIPSDLPAEKPADRPSLAQLEEGAKTQTLAASKKRKSSKIETKTETQTENQTSVESVASKPDRKQEEPVGSPRILRGPQAARRKAQEQALRNGRVQGEIKRSEAENHPMGEDISNSARREVLTPGAEIGGQAAQTDEAQVPAGQQPAEPRAVRRRTRRTYLTSDKQTGTASVAPSKKEQDSTLRDPAPAQAEQVSEAVAQQPEKQVRKGEKPGRKDAAQSSAPQTSRRKSTQQVNAPSLSREDLSAMKIAPLREKARQLGLNPQGIKKADLVELLYKEAASQEGFRSCVGILDITNDGYGFLRCDGYMPSSKDCFVIPQLIKQYGLRSGDELEVETVPPRGKKNGYPPVANISKVNGRKPEDMKLRSKFKHLTPVYPDQLLVMEHGHDTITGRAIDIVAPIGKGQRGLIVSPPKAGKTTILKKVCASIAENNPEVHLICLLVDERPEEVTDMERSIKGEVVASTFDMPAENHTQVSELVIERAKRLVELGEDVVVVLDSITRLARAYNIAQPASGRVLSGGVDSAALYPPKRFLGAARNIEGGGSLTILASALVDTGSKMDEVIFEEFKGTGNMELKLDRDLANKRIYPAIDPVASGTRNEDLLLDPEARQYIWTLKRVLANMNNTERAESMLIKGLKQTESNAEFLSRFAKKAKQAEYGDSD